MCLRDEIKFPENNDVIYGWKIFEERAGKLRSFWREGDPYPLQTPQTATVFRSLMGDYVPITLDNNFEAGFYFFLDRAEAIVALREHRKYAGMGVKFVLALCRFEGILAEGQDNTFGGKTKPRLAARAINMEIVEVARSHKKKASKE